MDEREGLKKEIDRYLKSLRPTVYFEKRWGGGVFGKKGVADWTGSAWGKFCAIEAKHPITKPPLEPAQKIYFAQIKAAGGYTCEATSVTDVAVFMALIAKLP